MKNIVKSESYNPTDLEKRLQSYEVEELDSRLEMYSSWCISECGTEKPTK